MKKLLALILACLLLAGCGSAEPTTPSEPPAPTEAAEPTEAPQVFAPAAPIAMELDTAIGDYDLTGDGAADTLLIRCQEADEYNDWLTFGYHWEFLVNGEPALEIKTDWPVRPEAELYQVSPDRSYLAICQRLDTNDDMADYGLYQYVGGKLEKVCDFYCTQLDERHVFHYGARLVTVAGDRIVLRGGNQFNATAYLEWDMAFAYESGAWVPTGNVYPVVYEGEHMEAKADGMTANQALMVHTSLLADETAYTVPRGGVLTIDRLCIMEGQVFFHVTNEEGKDGWLKDPEQVFSTVDGEDLLGYFEEAVFAG